MLLHVLTLVTQRLQGDLARTQATQQSHEQPRDLEQPGPSRASRSSMAMDIDATPSERALGKRPEIPSFSRIQVGPSLSVAERRSHLPGHR